MTIPKVTSPKEVSDRIALDTDTKDALCFLIASVETRINFLENKHNATVHIGDHTHDEFRSGSVVRNTTLLCSYGQCNRKGDYEVLYYPEIGPQLSNLSCEHHFKEIPKLVHRAKGGRLTIRRF